MAETNGGSRRVHPIVRLDYFVRLVACPLILLIVTSSRLGGGESVSLGQWLLFGLYAFAWPHVAYFFARRTEGIAVRETGFLLFDSAVAGLATALAAFRPVPTLVLVTGFSSILTSIGGVPLLARGLVALGAAALLTGWLVTGFEVQTRTPILAEMASAAVLFSFQTLMGLLTYRTARNFVTSRRQIAEQAAEIQRQNQALREAREEALQAAKAKSAFLATMSHEIRTPLNGVLGMTRLLAETPLTPEQHDLLRTVQVSGSTLVTVINDILDYSKIESGRLELEEEPLSLAEIVEESLEIVSERVRGKPVELVCDISREVPAAVLGDPTRLRQIVTNLVGNAVKFTEKGEVVVGVRQLRAAADGEPAEIAVAVRDTGIGIPADRIPLLFNAFSQADSSTTRRYGGTGLGLAISKRLVELMGGQISVESAPGRGTTFTFTIRAKAAAAQPPRRRHVGASGNRVLVVDDNETNRRVLCGQLELWGFKPTAAGGAAAAVSAIQNDGPFALAILDYHMPDVDGLSLARQIRGARRDFPLILLSSSLVLAKDDPERFFAARLLKPARQSSLFDAIMIALGGEAPARSQSSEPGLRLIAGGAPLRILVADDNEINREVARLLLRRFGYEADYAVNGRDAVERVAHRAAPGDHEGPYDLVLMDVQMPELDGLEATRAIRRLQAERPSQRWPRIVAMTANAMQEDRDTCLAAGMDGYLTKPLDFEAVRKALGAAAAASQGASASQESPAPETVPPSQTPPASQPVIRSVPAGQSPEAHPHETRVDAKAPPLAIVDWARLEELREYDTPEGAVVKGAIASLADQAPALLAEIQRSAAGRDAAALRASAHKLKGAASNIGALAVAECSSRLEIAGRSQALDDLSPLVEQLSAALDTTLGRLRDYVALGAVVQSGGASPGGPASESRRVSG